MCTAEGITRLIVNILDSNGQAAIRKQDASVHCFQFVQACGQKEKGAFQKQPDDLETTRLIISDWFYLLVLFVLLLGPFCSKAWC
jgi:hypothetical protein